MPAPNIVLGIGDLGSSRSPGHIIRTYALGSCVAVMMYNPALRTAGMVHIALPTSDIDTGKAAKKPGYFADTGIAALIGQMTKLGCPPRGMTIKIAGGAQVMDPNNTFSIGKRNILAVRKVLWSYGIGPIAEDVGGHISRTVTMLVDTGQVILNSHVRGEWQL